MYSCAIVNPTAQLGQHARQSERREALELVDVDEEIAAVRDRHVSTAVRGKADRGDEQAS